MKTLGMIGGMGWESSITYYRIINKEVQTALGGWHSARIILDSMEFSRIAQAEEKRDLAYIEETLMASAKRLEQAGADGILIACNTVHRFAQSVADAVSIPLLHIADAAGEALRADGHKKVGLLGTRPTMQGRFYKGRLKERFGLDVVIPDKASQAKVHGMIMHELNAHGSPEACAPQLDLIVEELAEAGVTAILLACTELGLVYASTEAPRLHRILPLYDTAVVHAHTAVRFVLSD